VLFRSKFGMSWFGILLMAILTSFGAPFWFDALSKLVNMRSSGIKSLMTRKQDGSV